MFLGEFKKLSKLAWPLVLAQLAQNTLSFIDTLMVGKLGDEALAGIAIGGSAFHFVLFTVSGVLFAVNPMVSQAMGAGQPDEVPMLVRQGMWIGLLCFFPIFVIFWNAEPLLILLGQSEQVAATSSQYLRAISWGALPALLCVNLRGFLEGTSNTRPILIISGLAIGLNIFFNDAFIFGRYGLPALGLVGTGVASSIVYTLIFLITAAYIRITQAESYPDVVAWSAPNWPQLLELARVGIPIALTIGFEAGLFVGAAFFMGTIDEQQLAAHQIAMQSASITFMIPLGIALATCVRVGNLAGEADWQGAKIAGYLGMGLATAMMCLSAAVFLLVPQLIVHGYMDLNEGENQIVVGHAVSFLRIAGMFQVFDGLQVAASNALRGLKETRTVMNRTLVSYWLLGVPACLLLAFTLGMEGRGLWYGLTIGLAAAAISLTWRFHRYFADEFHGATP